MKATACSVTGALLVLGLSLGVPAAQAAPNIPPSDMPGRERQRFLETPLDRYTDPSITPRSVEPLWQWQCHQRSTSRYRRAKKNGGC